MNEAEAGRAGIPARQGEWRRRRRGDSRRGAGAGWWPRKVAAELGRAGRGTAGEGAFPAAALSAAIGLVAFGDELSGIGFQLQPPGRPRRRGAGGGSSIRSWPRRPTRPVHKGGGPGRPWGGR